MVVHTGASGVPVRLRRAGGRSVSLHCSVLSTLCVSHQVCSLRIMCLVIPKLLGAVIKAVRRVRSLSAKPSSGCKECLRDWMII